MARSRRRNRRSTSQNAASLLALALPAPFQRVANSQLGPMLIFFGLPAMLIFGLLQVDWQDGTPQLRVNPQKTSELKAAVREHLENLDNQPLIRQWQQATGQSWNSQQPSLHQQLPQQQSASQQHYPYPQPTAAQPPMRNSSLVRNTQAPFPSTNPPTYVSTTSRPQTNNQNYSLQQQPMIPLQQQYGQPQHSQQQYGNQPYAQQSMVSSQQLDAQSPLSQQQPMVSLQQPYSQPQYTQQQLSEQQLYQQQLYQQRLYEQQLYEQQLYQQRQRFQQQSSQQQSAPTAQTLPAQPAWRNR